MSQVGDSSASDWQGWFTLKNSSTFCRVKADFILFGCRVGNLSLLELEYLGWIIQPFLDYAPLAFGSPPGAGAFSRRLPSPGWWHGVLGEAQPAQLEVRFLHSPWTAPTSLSAPFCVAALFNLIHLPAIFKLFDRPGQYFGNIFFLNSSLYASPKYNYCQVLKQKTLLRKYY